MSQHLINDFIHRTSIFKPLTGEKIINKKLVKYQASNRKNNTSPQDIEESVHDLKTDKVNTLVVDPISNNEGKQSKENGQKKNNDDSDKTEHIDIIV